MGSCNARGYPELSPHITHSLFETCQAGLVPLEVHASADDIARKFGAGRRAHDGGTTSSGERTGGRHERTVGKGHAAQVVMEILNLRAPLPCTHHFKPAPRL